jgi:hypothetical protein
MHAIYAFKGSHPQTHARARASARVYACLALRVYNPPGDAWKDYIFESICILMKVCRIALPNAQAHRAMPWLKIQSIFMKK